jgi:hypothetical protein
VRRYVSDSEQDLSSDTLYYELDRCEQHTHTHVTCLGQAEQRAKGPQPGWEADCAARCFRPQRPDTPTIEQLDADAPESSHHQE